MFSGFGKLRIPQNFSNPACPIAKEARTDLRLISYPVLPPLLSERDDPSNLVLVSKGVSVLQKSQTSDKCSARPSLLLNFRVKFDAIFFQALQAVALFRH